MTLDWQLWAFLASVRSSKHDLSGTIYLKLIMNRVPYPVAVTVTVILAGRQELFKTAPVSIYTTPQSKPRGDVRSCAVAVRDRNTIVDLDTRSCAGAYSARVSRWCFGSAALSMAEMIHTQYGSHGV